ncbi:hypothetical protein WI523_11380 [Gemmatimonadota bacterium CCK-12]
MAAWALALYRGVDPDRVVDTVRCGRCRTEYFVTVRAYHGAA